jgi:hypothetical protein
MDLDDTKDLFFILHSTALLLRRLPLASVNKGGVRLSHPAAFATAEDEIYHLPHDCSAIAEPHFCNTTTFKIPPVQTWRFAMIDSASSNLVVMSRIVTNYCTPESSSTHRCFRGRAAAKGTVDTFRKADNLWQSLIEVIAVFVNLDTLRISRSDDTKCPLLSSADVVQYAILDDYRKGAFYDLWKLFALDGIVQKKNTLNKAYSNARLVTLVMLAIYQVRISRGDFDRWDAELWLWWTNVSK